MKEDNTYENKILELESALKEALRWFHLRRELSDRSLPDAPKWTEVDTHWREANAAVEVARAWIRFYEGQVDRPKDAS